jgi:DNA repair exonuclease SbcCD ATPase subunit
MRFTRNWLAAAAERDEMLSSTRRDQINVEIRKIEEKIDGLKRKIEDENSLLNKLKANADAQNSLVTLQEQCQKELDVIDENIRDELYALNAANVAAPPVLPNEDDDDGEQLVKAISAMELQARETYKAANTRLDGSKEEVVSFQKTVSEKSALLAGSQKSLTSVKAKLVTLASSVSDMQKTVQDLRQHEAERGATLRATEDTPRELLQYLDERLQEIEEDSPDVNAAQVAQKVIKRLTKMASIASNSMWSFRHSSLIARSRHARLK